MNTEKTNIEKENSSNLLFLSQHKYKYLFALLLLYPFIWAYSQAYFRVHYNYSIVQFAIFFGGLLLWAFLIKPIMFVLQMKPIVRLGLQVGVVFFGFSLSTSIYQLKPHITGDIIQVDSLIHIWENRGKGVVFNIDTIIKYNKKDETLFVRKVKKRIEYYYVFPVLAENKALAGRIWVGVNSDTLLREPTTVFKNQAFREVYYVEKDHFLEAISLSKYKEKKQEVIILTADKSQEKLGSYWTDISYYCKIYCIYISFILALHFIVSLFTK